MGKIISGDIMKKILAILMVLTLTLVFVSDKTQEEPEKNSIHTDEAAATTKEKEVKTFTGYKALEEIELTVSDPENTSGLSTVKIAHSYGVAKDGKPHQISIDYQKYFEKSGYKAITYNNGSDKALYLTFDCGYENGYTSKVLDTLKEKNVKAAFFCTLDEIKSEPELIARMIKEGHIVGNHSATHPSFAEISRLKMAEEIEVCDNYLRTHFGYSSKFFRFPKGEYSESALNLVDGLGYTSVFWSLAYADWDTANQKGWQYAFDKVTSRLHPGAIILLHSVSQDNAEALGKIIDYAVENGYKFASIDTIKFS